MKINYIILFLFIFSFIACYDDKGNYDYKDINTVMVELDELYSVRLDKDTTITITPRLSQLLQKDEENLSYVWLYSKTNHNFYGLASSNGLIQLVQNEFTVSYRS